MMTIRLNTGKGTDNMLNTVEMWLLEKLLSEAESPAAKAWVLSQLRAADAASKSKLLKVVLDAVEGFLAAPPAP